MGSARQSSERIFKLEVYQQSTFHQDVGFQLADLSQATTAQSGLGFPTQTNLDITAEQNGNALFTKWTYQPWENIQYSFLFGAGNYTLKIPSTSVTNTLTGDQVGFSYGVGAKVNLFPDTAVTPALAFDAGLLWTRYFFNEMNQGGLGTSSVDDRLDLYHTHVVMQGSHRWGRWEPFGGVKWLRTQAHLKDLIQGSKVGGKEDAVTPFLGLKFMIYSHESLMLEASFVKGVQVNTGLELRFQ
ncbi:MAG: hypothetical protein HY400_02560 [Elusimicrobia bacterium]|nr:hypothetical protein [Elusimicrobiota bacterium]